jgi:O-acetyl-ADP-ribose deacetylase (regulator of RNase III)
MIMYKSSGNILNSDCTWITIPVNCMGTMGAGLAKEAAMRFPQQEAIYKTYCKEGELRPGIIKTAYPLIFLPTKDHWRLPSKYEYVQTGLEALRGVVTAPSVTWDSLALPALGCGLGGLKWSVVQTLIEHYLTDLDIYIEVYKPQGA